MWDWCCKDCWDEISAMLVNTRGLSEPYQNIALVWRCKECLCHYFAIDFYVCRHVSLYFAIYYCFLQRIFFTPWLTSTHSYRFSNSTSRGYERTSGPDHILWCVFRGGRKKSICTQSYPGCTLCLLQHFIIQHKLKFLFCGGKCFLINTKLNWYYGHSVFFRRKYQSQG